MHSLQKRFQNYIHQHQLCSDRDRVLLAVSGGLDSMVMLDLFHRSEFNIAVAHCNFGLRGKESDGDEEFVVAWTQERGIDCHVKKIDLGEGSVQVRAREERYKWFDELSEKEGFTRLATAHHLDDSLETTLLNLVRGTGVEGVKGIALQRDSIIRPLQFATREELRLYAGETGLDWREDSSNQKTEYYRNKIRLDVVPILKTMNPSLMSTYRNTKERLEYTSKLIESRVNEIQERHFDIGKKELQLTWIQGEEDLLILSELLAPFGFNYVTSKEVFAARGKSGKQFPVGRYTAFMDRDSLLLKEQTDTKDQEIVIGDDGIYQINQTTVRVERVEVTTDLNQGSSVAFFDASKCSFPLKMRRWKDGDEFKPLGMNGTKKVSDLLIDLKVPLASKEEVLVLECQEQIAWVVGMRMAEPFKVAGDTKTLLRLEILTDQ